jgi:hypothetical protein
MNMERGAKRVRELPIQRTERERQWETMACPFCQALRLTGWGVLIRGTSVTPALWPLYRDTNTVWVQVFMTGIFVGRITAGHCDTVHHVHQIFAQRRNRMELWLILSPLVQGPGKRFGWAEVRSGTLYLPSMI